MRVVAALGGNALSSSRGHGSAEEMRAALAQTTRLLADLVDAGVSLVVTHGNGPQIGRILLQQEYAARHVAPMPMDVCGAESQGQVGYLLVEALAGELRSRGRSVEPVCVLTRVVVDADDPAFRRPSKPVGPVVDATTADRVGVATGQVFREVAPGHWRRVVASPLPRGFLEATAVRRLVEAGHLVVAAGGGGVPVVASGAGWRGVEAVVDKDRSAVALARLVGAELLLLLTDVARVEIGYGTPQARPLRRLSAPQARRLLALGTFPDGSMGPKVEACCEFVESGGRRAVIAALSDTAAAVFGAGGTQVTRR